LDFETIASLDCGERSYIENSELCKLIIKVIFYFHTKGGNK